jgi:two-component system nitrogen regulation sensor histidine kinase NtrY
MTNTTVRNGSWASLMAKGAWPRLSRGRLLFAIGFVLAFLITGLAVWLVAAAPGAGPIDAASRTLIAVLALNLLLILALASAIGLRVARVARQRKADAGARLHLRFVTLFSAAAVVPAILVAMFFGVLVTRGVDGWFAQRVQTAVEKGASIGKSYVSQEVNSAANDLVDMSTDMDQIRSLFPNRLSFSNAFGSLARIRGFQAAYILDRQGTILARTEAGGVGAYRAPPQETLDHAATGELQVGIYDKPDAVRAVYRLKNYDGAYLYGVRLQQKNILAQLRSAEQSVVDYREAEAARTRVQLAFGMAYLEISLLVLVGAAWLGMTAAGAISRPIARLVQAADRIAGGDLSARVETAEDPDEMAVLSRAFNRMTGDLQAQQEALKAASAEALDRSRFIETVLSGVSAGVIGLDERARVSAINDQALALLGLRDHRAAHGQPLAKVAPELAAIVRRPDPMTVDHDVDVTRGSETRRLRVRVSGGEEGGLVLTFDDITRLMTAQRNAAWRDVARRIAHEIKNPLTPIQLSAERLRRKYRSQVTGDLETFDRCTDTIIRQVGDIGRMVDEFSAFARMPAPNFAPENAAELLRQAVFAQRVAAPEIELDLTEMPASIAFTADGRMVAQALTNVLKNAGESVMARRALDPNAKGRMLAVLEQDNEHLTFVVEDDGVGLPAKDRDRLAEPYVTTREKGTGLGLAIVKRICEDHGGELLLGDAQVLSGARVSLRFPKTLTAAPQRAAETTTA